MLDWNLSLDKSTCGTFGSGNHPILSIDDFMASPQSALEVASRQNFAKTIPQYPGIRAPLPPQVCSQWVEALSPRLDEVFGEGSGSQGGGWEIQAWFSIVTTKADQLLPIQRFPHVDGTDPRQLAMMLYLHETEHGGTGFYRHRSSGLEALTDETFPRYRSALERDVQEGGLPASAYVTDGAPYFERFYASEGAFNQAVFYRGNLLHSGLISNTAKLTSDPRTGRFTINAFLRPVAPA